MSKPPKEREGRDRRAAMRRLVAPFRAQVVWLSIASFLGGMVEAAFLVTVTRAGLAITEGETTVELGFGVGLSVGETVAVGATLVLVRFVLAIAALRWSAALNALVASDLRHRLARAYLGASWATQQAEPAGRLQQLLLNFINQARTAINILTASITAALSLVALITMAVVVDPLATLAVVGALLALGLVLVPLRSRVRARSRLATDAELQFGDSVAELGALGMEMQAFGVRKEFRRHIEDLIDEEVELRRRTELLRNAVHPVYISLGYLAILGAIGAASVVGTGELATVGAVMLLMLRSLTYGQTLQTSAANLAAILPFIEKLEQTERQYLDRPATSGPIRLERVGSIEGAGVSFAYGDGPLVLHDLTFRIEPGEVVGVVGPSGSGKSTLVQLLLGLRDPTDGTITVDGFDLRTVDRATWSRRIAFVPQEALLYSAAVVDNIRFFRHGITDERVRAAARQAHVADEVEHMPDGYDTLVGERGSRVSGGQRQRLSIARALAGGPELLILDEPTSSLDVRSESLIRDTLAELKGRVTVVVIAHRMSTLEVCDRIMVIQHGELKAFAPKAELSLSNEFYREALELSGLS